MLPAPARPRFLGVILTSRCTARCGHCLYFCSTERTERLLPADLAPLLRDVGRLAHPPPSVHIGGGEPCLLPEATAEVVRLVLEAGLRLDFVETAGGWSASPPQVLTRLLMLREAGLTNLLISTSPFHQEFASPAAIRRFMRVATAVFGPDRIVYNTSDLLEDVERISRARPLPFADYVAAVGFDHARSMLDRGNLPLNLAGRAAITLRRYLPRRPADTWSEDCERWLLHSRSWHIDAGPRIHTGYCAGITYRVEGDLQSWYTAFPGADYPVTGVLVSGGLAALLAFAVSVCGFVPDPDGYVSACDACQHARLALWRRGGYPELGPDGFYAELEHSLALA
jgi:hypothetical protein